MDTQPRVFISYARADGEAFAADLRARLAAELGTEALWRDRDRMEGGVNWWKQITEALEAVSFMVLVATPAALASPVVRKEWRYARQQGVCVYPVQVPGLPIDFAALPRWMRDSHFYNLDKEWETFINYLKHSCHAEKVPFMAPDLPAHFVERPREFGELVSRLLDADRQNPVAITTALKGAGGFGKTTLAIALCHDEDVQAAFDDGILWVTLGEQPDVLGGLTKLYAALTGERTAFIDVEDAAKELADKLADKDCLIVIDDVWNGVHLQAFLRGGERCARLITTRDVGIAVGAKATMTDVDEMTASESIQLLSNSISGLERGHLERMAKRLGEWALMLELANAMLRERMATGGDSPERAFAWLEKVLDRRRVTGVHRDNEEKRKQDVAGVLASSLELLTADQRERLCQLAVFKDDADVPLSSVYRLWGMDEFDAEELVLLLARRTLLKFSSSTGTIRLHDVVREYLATQVADMPALHRKLIEAWGDLYALPDGYAWNWIGYHLVEAGQSGRLRDLLLDFRWLEAKLNATDISALLETFSAATSNISLRLVWQALSMSAHLLTDDKSQLEAQLRGRLSIHRADTEIGTILTGITAPKGSLIPINKDLPALYTAGGHLLRILVGHTGIVNGALALANGCFLSWSNDNTLRLWGADGTPLKILKGHLDSVYGALELANGCFLSWSKDRMLRMWTSNGAPMAILEGHQNWVEGALELVDGRLLSWSGDETLRLWTSNGEPLAVLEGHADRVEGALALNDGRFLSWSNDETLRLWAMDGTPLTVLEGHTYGIREALALVDGRFLSWSRDDMLRLWATDGTPLAILEGHTNWVNGARALVDGRFLSWSNDCTLRLWSCEGTPLAILEGHTNEVNGALALANGHLISWSGNPNGVPSRDTLRLWGNNGEALTTLVGHTDSAYGALELANGCILSWSKDRTLRLWRSDGEPLTTLEGHIGRVLGVLALADERFLSWSDDETLRLWSAVGNSPSILEQHTRWVQEIIALADGRFLSWSSYDNMLQVWSSDGTPLAVLEGHTSWLHGALALSDNSIVSWSEDMTLRRWSPDGTELAHFVGHASAVRGALALDDGSILSWSYDNTLRRWSPDGTELAHFFGHQESVHGALALDNGSILSWSADGTLRHWSPDGTERARFVGHTRDVRGALALDDGSILSWSADETLRLWATDSAPLTVLKGHTYGVQNALALDDGTILSWSADNTLRRWSHDGPELARLETGSERTSNWDRQAVCRWARTQGFSASALFAAVGDVPFLGAWVARRGHMVYVYDASTGETLARFVGDDEITCLAASGDVIAAGDAAGRVLFLRWQPPTA